MEMKAERVGTQAVIRVHGMCYAEHCVREVKGFQ